MWLRVTGSLCRDERGSGLAWLAGISSRGWGGPLLHRPGVRAGAGEEGLFLAHCPPKTAITPRERQYPEPAAGDNWGWSVAENFVLLFLFKLKTGTWSHELIC